MESRRSYSPRRYRYLFPETEASKRKVVSVPVRFVHSDRQRAAAAVKIQRVLRGFLVRKNARVVRAIEADVAAERRRIEADLEKIRLDPMERLRRSERLMTLLILLDSVRGVREYRRKVIRQIISLQEAVDAAAETLETREPVETSREPNDTAVTDESPNSETLDEPEPEPIEEESRESRDLTGESAAEEVVDDDYEFVEAVEKVTENPTAESERLAAKLCEQSDKQCPTAESERLMDLVAKLLEQSEKQCSLMTGLVERVEQLEQSVQRIEGKKMKKKQKKACCQQQQQLTL